MPYGYATYRAESPLSSRQQQDADRQLGRFFAALPRLRRWRARPVRACPLAAGAEAGGGLGQAPA